MGKSRLTKNQSMYRKEVQRINRSMKRYAKQGYQFSAMETYFPTPKRITRKTIKNLQSYKGIKIRNLGNLVQSDTNTINQNVQKLAKTELSNSSFVEDEIVQTSKDEDVADYKVLARIQIDNLYSELDNFPSELKSFLVQQFDDIMYKAGLNAIETYGLDDIDINDINAVRDEGKIYLAMAIQNSPSLVYHIQNSGYGSWQAIADYCSMIVNELDDLGVLGTSERMELEDLFEMQLGFYENNAQLRKARKKEERRKIREEIKRLRKAGIEYKNGKASYSTSKLAERTKRLQQVNAESIAKMSDEEFRRWAKGYR